MTADNSGENALRRLLFVSHTHAFGPFRIGSHHYARTLAARGVDVVHLSTPISLAHRLTGRVSGPTDAAVPRGPSRDSVGVTHLVPRTVFPRPFGPFRVAKALTAHGIDPRFDALLVDQPLLWDDSIRILAPLLVYRPTDLYPTGKKSEAQQRILASADAVVATSAEVLAELGPVRQPVLVLENGVDAAHFVDPAHTADTHPNVCVYVGALDGRFDWPQLVAWARTHEDVRFVVAGPVHDLPTALPTNVKAIGAIGYGELPKLLHGARVGLLPLSDDPLNAARSPMKLYEYLAAGLAVLSRETPVIKQDAQAGIFTYADPRDADSALRRALEHPSPNVVGAQRAAAESWEAKTDALLAFLGGLARR